MRHILHFLKHGRGKTKSSLCVLALVILSLLVQPERTLARNVDNGEDLIHYVSSGESLNGIARQYLHSHLPVSS